MILVSNEPERHKRPELSKMNVVRSYATKALVPYTKDDNFPESRGAQDAVYKAVLKTTSGLLQRSRIQAFAIKEIQLVDNRTRERLRNEIKHLRICDHPNILRLREAYTIDQDQ
jgi:serine/threonine protein kinase